MKEETIKNQKGQSLNDELVFQVENCNNIKDAKITITSGTNNIKFAPNGSGKSTIARAIAWSSEPDRLAELSSFLYEDQPSVKQLSGNKMQHIEVFDEAFVNDFVFREDAVIDNAFEVFIKSDEYDALKKKIDDGMAELKNQLFENDTIGSLLTKVRDFIKLFPLNKNGEIRASGTYKAIENHGSVLNQPPKGLKRFLPFLRNANNSAAWTGWKLIGSKYDREKICPYCANKKRANHDDCVEEFRKTYNKSDVGHIVEAQEKLMALKDFVDESQFLQIIQRINTPPPEEDDWLDPLDKFISESITIGDAIARIVGFDFHDVQPDRISALPEELEQLKINNASYRYYTSNLVKDAISALNLAIEALRQSAEELKQDFGRMNGIISNAIRTAESEVNAFLELAGFPYRCKIVKEDTDEKNAKMLLEYRSPTNQLVPVTNIRRHLSWGEKNAFALVLFMYYALSKKADLIILDDPISSFDGNKKYAIFERLFKNIPTRKNLAQQTVLLLTHDFEPVIDFGIVQKPSGKASISALRNNNGIVNENMLDLDNDIETVIKMYFNNARDEKKTTVTRVCFLRKGVEYLSTVEDGWRDAYDILSSLIHTKEKISNIDNNALNDTCIENGIAKISQFMPSFDYGEYLELFRPEQLEKAYKEAETPYEKLLIYRVYRGQNQNTDSTSDATRKYADESYHVENDYMYQLDPTRFDPVPKHILEEIDKVMADCSDSSNKK